MLSLSMCWFYSYLTMISSYNAITQREIVMMRFMNTIMEKPEWNRKVSSNI